MRQCSLNADNWDSFFIEKNYKTKQAKYGRAATVYPRTLEIFDQLDVLEPLAQIGYISRNYVNYRNGKRSGPGGFNALLSQMHDTFCNFVLNIRQKYVEESLQEAFEFHGGKTYEGTELIAFVLNDDASNDYAGMATLTHVTGGCQRQIKL